MRECTTCWVFIPFLFTNPQMQPEAAAIRAGLTLRRDATTLSTARKSENEAGKNTQMHRSKAHTEAINKQNQGGKKNNFTGDF